MNGYRCICLRLRFEVPTSKPLKCCKILENSLKTCGLTTNYCITNYYGKDLTTKI